VPSPNSISCKVGHLEYLVLIPFFLSLPGMSLIRGSVREEECGIPSSGVFYYLSFVWNKRSSLSLSIVCETCEGCICTRGHAATISYLCLVSSLLSVLKYVYIPRRPSDNLRLETSSWIKIFIFILIYLYWKKGICIQFMYLKSNIPRPGNFKIYTQTRKL
jgi:hypothetical protein